MKPSDQKIVFKLKHRITGENATLEQIFPDSESAVEQIDVWKRTLAGQGYNIVDYTLETHLGKLQRETKARCMIHGDRYAIATWEKVEKTKEGILTARYLLSMCHPCFSEFTGKDPKPRERLMTLAIDQLTLRPETDL